MASQPSGAPSGCPLPAEPLSQVLPPTSGARGPRADTGAAPGLCEDHGPRADTGAAPARPTPGLRETLRAAAAAPSRRVLTSLLVLESGDDPSFPLVLVLCGLVLWCCAVSRVHYYSERLPPRFVHASPCRSALGPPVHQALCKAHSRARDRQTCLVELPFPWKPGSPERRGSPSPLKTKPAVPSAGLCLRGANQLRPT